MPATDLHEPDRRIDRLIQFIEDQDDPDLPAWAVEALAGGLAVDVAVADGDEPLERLEGLAEALGSRFALVLDGEDGDAAPRVLRTMLTGFFRGLRGE